MPILTRGRYYARFANSEQELAAAQRLRFLAFECQVSHGVQCDQDAHDTQCEHVLVKTQTSDQLVCCYRLMFLPSGRAIAQSYSSQYYDLTALEVFDGPMIEVGRFCVHPAYLDPDILRVAWAALAKIVDDRQAQLLFGCTSFKGVEPATYTDVFAMLRERYLAPSRWLPRVKAPTVFPYAKQTQQKPDPKQAMRKMPPLLKTYLAMGGWVSDHAVIDNALNTLHVFTGVEIKSIPPSRKRQLRAVVNGAA